LFQRCFPLATLTRCAAGAPNFKRRITEFNLVKLRQRFTAAARRFTHSGYCNVEGELGIAKQFAKRPDRLRNT